MSITEGRVATARHETAFLAAGPEGGAPMIFVHGWPELSYSWRAQLPVFAGLGFRCIAPDMRGYGRSRVHPRHEDYALPEIVADLMELADGLGIDKAVWVGHDWGAPAVWSVAQQRPDRVHAVASLCVPYQPEGFGAETVIPLADRRVYPEDKYPAAQWDYQLFYRENFPAAQTAFEADVRNTVRALFRGGNPDYRGKPAITSMVRAAGGWFGPGAPAPAVPRDERVLSAADEDVYVEALSRNGFFGPGSWYMNAAANTAYARTVPENWRISVPVLFLHGANDFVCETLDSHLAEPMRDYCADLTERVIESGHWMAQERPVEVNAALARWLADKLPHLWPPSVSPATRR